MKTLKRLAAVSVLATSAFAQAPGFFISAGGGYAKVQTESFSLTTNINGEVLHSLSDSDTVTFASIEGGCRFNSNWSVGLGYSDYGTAEIPIALPTYKGIISIVALPQYTRNVLIYDSHQFELVPTYSRALGERWTFHARAGVTYRETKAHFETSYREFQTAGFRDVSKTFSEEKTTNWSYLVSLGIEFNVTPRFSVGVMGTYSPSKMTLPREDLDTVGTPRPSQNEIDVDYFQVAITLGWR